MLMMTTERMETEVRRKGLTVTGISVTVENDGGKVAVSELKNQATKRKGRGFQPEPKYEHDRRELLENQVCDSISPFDKDELPDDVPVQRSAEGWILIVTGVHDEAMEDDVLGPFSEHGQVKNIHLNLDRRTGLLKGYALIEYDNYKAAKTTKDMLDGTNFLGERINVDWAFMKKGLPVPSKSSQSSSRRR